MTTIIIVNFKIKITLLTNVLYHVANKRDLPNHCMKQYNEQQQQRAERESNDKILGEEFKINFYLH